jgi:1-acyl-sn-glycerol-3-phosphate acyltransferase
VRALSTVLFNLYFILLTLILGLAGLIVRASRPDLAFALARLWIRLTVAGLGRIAGIRVEVLGRENLRDGGQIIASQHRAGLDALIWFTIVKRPAYVMKQELTRLPLVGPLLRPAGMIPVDRSAGASALRRMVGDVTAALASGREVVIFPEGTRVQPGARPTLAPGIAALAGRGWPIVPVATNSGRVWGRGYLLGSASRAGGRIIRIAVGAPLPEGLGRAGLIAAIEAAWDKAETEIVDRECG